MEGVIDTIAGWIEGVDLASSGERVALIEGELFPRSPGVPIAAKRAYRRDIWRICVHEAAHALLAHRMGLHVTRVVVCHDGTGLTYYENPQNDVFAEAVTKMAGPAVELLWFVADSDVIRRVALARSYDILQCARHLADSCYPARLIAQVAVGAVLEQEPWISRVARALSTHRDLSGEEVRQLCETPAELH